MTAYVRFQLVFMWLPTLALWMLRFPLLWKYRKTILLTIPATFIFGTPFDVLAVKTGLWRYDVSPTLGHWWYGLPLEEFLCTLTFPLMLTSAALVVRDEMMRRAHVR
ncbi:MAG: lycopene cyclase domain-containing protein [bacterium]